MTAFAHGYALLIGVGAHKNPTNALPATVSDATAIERILRDEARCAYPADHIRLLHDESATRQGILDNLAWLKTCAEGDREATIVIYYSGHGHYSMMTGEYWLIPYDAVDTASALTAAEFTEALRAISAERLLVVLDCCRAEGMATSKDGSLGDSDLQPMQPNQPIISALKQGSGRVVFTSSRGTQRSFIRPEQDLSIFTYHLLEALQGANNQPGETVVMVSNLMNHLSKTVPQSADAAGQNQTPFFDFTTEDFPVAAIAGGKGLSSGGWQAVAAEAQATIAAVTPPPTNRGTVTITGNAKVNGVVGGVITGDITYHARDRDASR